MTRRFKDQDPPKFIVQTLPPPPEKKRGAPKKDEPDQRAQAHGSQAPKVSSAASGSRPKRGRPHNSSKQGGEGRQKKQKPAQETDSQVPQEESRQATQQAQVGQAQREDLTSGQGQHGHQEETQQDQGPQQSHLASQHQDKADSTEHQQGQGPAEQPKPKEQERQGGQEPAHQAPETGQGQEPDGHAQRKKEQLAAARERLSLRRKEKAEIRAMERMLRDQAFQEKKRELAEMKAAMLEKQYKEMQEATRKEIEKAELQKRGVKLGEDPHYIPAPLPPRSLPLGLTPEAKNREDLPPLGTAPGDVEEETKRLYELLRPRQVSSVTAQSNPLTKRPPTQKAPLVPDPADLAEEDQAQILRMNVQREQEAKATAARIRKEMEDQRKDLLMQQVFGGL